MKIMQTFKYSPLAKFVYRYGNIPMTILLLIHLYVSVIALRESWLFVFPLSINLAVLYYMNRFYFRAYKKFPHKIEIDNTKMICSDFFIGPSSREIKLADIDEIKGGMFSGSMTRPVIIKSSSKNFEIGLSPHIKNYNQLLTIILTNIRHDIYHGLLTKMKEMGDQKKAAIEQKVKFKKKKPR